MLSESSRPSCCGADGYHALANIDQDKLSALLAEVCLEVAPFHAAGQKARLWFAGQAYRCTGSSLVSPSDNLVATEAGVCLVVGLLIV